MMMMSISSSTVPTCDVTCCCWHSYLCGVPDGCTFSRVAGGFGMVNAGFVPPLPGILPDVATTMRRSLLRVDIRCQYRILLRACHSACAIALRCLYLPVTCHWWLRTSYDLTPRRAYCGAQCNCCCLFSWWLLFTFACRIFCLLIVLFVILYCCVYYYWWLFWLCWYICLVAFSVIGSVRFVCFVCVCIGYASLFILIDLVCYVMVVMPFLLLGGDCYCHWTFVVLFVCYCYCLIIDSPPDCVCFRLRVCCLRLRTFAFVPFVYVWFRCLFYPVIDWLSIIDVIDMHCSARSCLPRRCLGVCPFWLQLLTLRCRLLLHILGIDYTRSVYVPCYIVYIIHTFYYVTYFRARTVPFAPYTFVWFWLLLFVIVYILLLLLLIYVRVSILHLWYILLLLHLHFLFLCVQRRLCWSVGVARTLLLMRCFCLSRGTLFCCDDFVILLLVCCCCWCALRCCNCCYSCGVDLNIALLCNSSPVVIVLFVLRLLFSYWYVFRYDCCWYVLLFYCFVYWCLFFMIAAY